MPSWCPVHLPNQNGASEHIHWPKGAGDALFDDDVMSVSPITYLNLALWWSDVSVAESIGYWRGSDFRMEVNYLHYLSDARQAIGASKRSVDPPDSNDAK